MPLTNTKNTALYTLLIFLGFVSRDLNAHHQRLSLDNTVHHPRTLSVVVKDILYAEPTLTIRRIK